MDSTDRRHRARRVINHIAHVATGLGPPLECHVSNVSETGARIVAEYPHVAPQEFLLMLNMDLHRWCRVVWRSEREIGVMFITTPQSVAADEPATAS